MALQIQWVIILPKYVGDSTHILNNSNGTSLVMVQSCTLMNQAKDTTMDARIV
jgi:hypothetical protein